MSARRLSSSRSSRWCARRDSNPHDVTHCHLKAARLPIPPRALGRSVWNLRRTGSTAADVTNQGWRDKARWHRGSAERRMVTGLAGARQPRQHSLDFDRNSVAINKHYPAGDREVVGEDFDLVRLGSIQLDDGAASQPHYLVDGYCCDDAATNEIDTDVIEGWHR